MLGLLDDAMTLQQNHYQALWLATPISPDHLIKFGQEKLFTLKVGHFSQGCSIYY